MVKYLLKICLVFVIIMICSSQYSFADIQSTNANLYYKDINLGILAYKQINAFKITLADGSVLSDATINTSSNVEIIDELKKVQIVFVIDTSGSMMGNKMNTTKIATQQLVNSLFEKIGSNNIEIGILYFNSGLDESKILELTNDQNAILQHLESIYASGGTRIADSLEKAQQMLQEQQSENSDNIKMVCTLSDGALGDEAKAIELLDKMNQSGISTNSIFVETALKDSFINLANKNTSVHKNFHTDAANLTEIIVKDIYNEIYLKIILLSDPKTVYNMNNAGIIYGDDKIIFQADEEILHGATLEIEYVISITSSFDCKNVKINDFYSEDLIYSQDKKLLTENRTNANYGWKIENGVLVNDSGVINLEAGKEYKVKLILSTVFTPTRLADLNRLGNYMTFSIKRMDNSTIMVDRIDNISNNKIKALDILIIPPTGRSEFMNKIGISLNITVIIVSFMLMIVCTIDYMKNNKHKKIK